MKQRLVIVLLLIASTVQAQVQTFNGSFPQLKNKEVVLKGYDGLQEKELAKALCDNEGHFTLSYPASYTGAALLQLNGAENSIVLLNRENFLMNWTDTKDINTLAFVNSPENDAFIKGYTINRDAEQKLAGLNYLLPQYEKYNDKYQWLKQEIAFQKKQFEEFVNQQPGTSYVSYYLKIRKFVNDMTQTIQKGNGSIPQYEAYFKTIDCNDERLWHSGMVADLFAGIYQLMANDKDTVNIKDRINNISDSWIKGLVSNSIKQQEVAEYCFKVLEQQNRVANSEYIAKTMLDQSGCQLDSKRTNLFEQYRKMALGNTAPDIKLPDGKKLSQLDNKYKLVIFGASWCPNCQTDYPSLVGVYKRIKDKYNVEFVFVSLDSDGKAFEDFFKEVPFITYCDTKGWESQPVKDYYIFATPTYLLLDKDLKIVAKPKNPEEVAYSLSTKH